jgi:prophage regulatory protein
MTRQMDHSGPISRWLEDEKCLRRYGEVGTANVLRRCREDLEKWWRQQSAGSSMASASRSWSPFGQPDAPQERAPEHKEPIDRLLRAREVLERVGVSRSTLWRMGRAGEFPKPRRISNNSVRWSQLEVEEWISARERA